jgi:hypothetical protein
MGVKREQPRNPFNQIRSGTAVLKLASGSRVPLCPGRGHRSENSNGDGNGNCDETVASLPSDVGCVEQARESQWKLAWMAPQGGFADVDDLHSCAPEPDPFLRWFISNGKM